MTFERITVEPGKMGGVACIRGLRIPVATVVAMVADGMSAAEIVAELSSLEVADVAEALRFPDVAVGIGEVPGVAAVEGLLGWVGGGRPGSGGGIHHLVDLLTGPDVVGQSEAGEPAAPVGRLPGSSSAGAP